MNDVALVALDTLRKDTFDRHFDWLSGTHFENAWSTSHWTGAVHASLFTGLYPGEAGTYAHNRTFDYPEPVLPERLRDAGYATRAFSCNVIVSAEFGFDRGFQTFDGSWNVERALTDDEVFDWHTLLREDQDLRTYLDGFRESIRDGVDTLPSVRRGLELATGRRELDYGARRAVDVLGDATFDDDSFLYVNLMEAHAPYRPPPEYRTVEQYETPDHPMYAAPEDDESFDPEAVRVAYEDSVRYLSDAYRELFETLEESFAYVITVGDHGEMFGEHGFYEHTYGIYPEATHVPVVVSGDDVEDDRREETVSLLDVHRTVADLAGVEAEGRGQNLLDDPESREYLAEYRGIPHPRQVESLTELGPSPDRIGAYDEPHYGIAFPDGSFAYQTGAANRTVEGMMTRGDPSVADQEARLEEHLADLDLREDGEDPADITASVVDRLEHLGYV